MRTRYLLALLLVLLLLALACSAPGRIVEIAEATLTAAPPIPTTPPIPTLPEVPTVPPLFPGDTPDPSRAQSVTLEEHAINEDSSTGQYTVEAVYPLLPADAPGAEIANAELETYVQDVVSYFREEATNAAEDPADAPGSGLRMYYDVLYNQDGLLSVRVWSSIMFKGAAHPNLFSASFSYDLTEESSLALADLFQPGTLYLDALAELCQDDLGVRDGMFWLDGASADLANYSVWNMTSEGLMITFDTYQVAAYALGPQEVVISWSELPYPGGLIDRLE